MYICRKMENKPLALINAVKLFHIYSTLSVVLKWWAALCSVPVYFSVVKTMQHGFCWLGMLVQCFLGRQQYMEHFWPPWFGFIKSSGNLIELEHEVKTRDVTLLWIFSSLSNRLMPSVAFFLLLSLGKLISVRYQNIAGRIDMMTGLQAYYHRRHMWRWRIELDG